MPRLTPYDIAFGPSAEEPFARIRHSLAAGGRDPHDLDAFVLDREVVSYLRELVPEEGIGSGIEQHVALLHHAYLYWAEGGIVVQPTKARIEKMLAAPPPNGNEEPPKAYYFQVPERLIWGGLAPEEPHQPLDGLFVRPYPDHGFFLLAVFGMHAGSEGFTVVDLDGYHDTELAREDGSPLFAPVLPGGAAAGLYSIAGGEELMELAARSASLAIEARACIGPAHHPHQPIELA
ncbi:MAG TPA: hypothetical protein VG817_09975 [Gemmatimonadales bacterium]|nr:hypothetical protein [Gemmatimonadales bacterium]